MAIPEHVIALIEIFIGAFRVLEDMMQWIADSIAGAMGYVLESKGVLMGVLLALFVVIQVALMGFIPTFFGSIAFGIFAGVTIGKLFVYDPTPSMDHGIDNSDPVVETEIIPYEQWPNECYVCRDDIPDDMEIRGQFVVHKGESQAKTKAVPLCEECTRTGSTLIDNNDRLVGIYDDREQPTEL